MARHGVRAAILTSLALVMGMVTACTAAPRESSTPHASTQPLGSAAPTPTPTTRIAEPVADEHLEIHWEPDQLIDLVDIAFSGGVVPGPRGWVAFGDCLPDGTADSRCPAAWSSAEGATWVGTRLTRHEMWIDQLASSAAGYVGSGDKGIWVSPEGDRWERAGVVRVDRCCPNINGTTLSPHGIALAPNGTILVGSVRDGTRLFGPFVSDDGRHWDLVEPSTFGADTFVVDRIASTASAVLMSGGACYRCVDGIWSSIDGRTWKRVASLDVSSGQVTSFATDGEQVLAAIERCTPSLDCRTEIWGSDHGDPMSLRLDNLNFLYTSVVSTNAGFVMVGMQAGNSLGQIASLDGRTWTGVVTDGLPNGDTDDCEPRAAARGSLIRLVIGYCGALVGTVRIAAGPTAPLP